MILESVITCPHCAIAKSEAMPTDACQFFYTCTGCGATLHTAPYYLAMIAPVLVLASGVVSVDFYAWLSLAVLILGGSTIIWWATERAWGKFS